MLPDEGGLDPSAGARSVSEFPLVSVVTLTIFLGSMLIAEGIIEMMPRLSSCRGARDGADSVQLSCRPAARCVDSGAVAEQLGLAVGTMVGVAILEVSGITRVAVSSTIRRAFGKAERAVNAA